MSLCDFVEIPWHAGAQGQDGILITYHLGVKRDKTKLLLTGAGLSIAFVFGAGEEVFRILSSSFSSRSRSLSLC